MLPNMFNVFSKSVFDLAKTEKLCDPDTVRTGHINEFRKRLFFGRESIRIRTVFVNYENIIPYIRRPFDVNRKTIFHKEPKRRSDLQVFDSITKINHFDAPCKNRLYNLKLLDYLDYNLLFLDCQVFFLKILDNRRKKG